MNQTIADRKRGLAEIILGVLQVSDPAERAILAAPVLLLGVDLVEHRLRLPAVMQGLTALAFIVAFFAALFLLGTLERRFEARELARERAAALAELSEEEQRAWLRAEQARGPAAGTQDASIAGSNDAQSY